MANNSEFIHAGFNLPPGGAKVEVWDTNHSTWQYLGKCSGVGFTTETEKIQQRHRVDGQNRVTQERVTSFRGMLRFTPMERLLPSLQQLIYGSRSTTQTLNSLDVAWEELERPLYINKETGEGIEALLTKASGCANYTRLPAVTSLAGTVTTTGGSGWTVGTNYFWAVPLHRKPGSSTVPSITTVCDATLLDIEWCFGAPTDASGTSSGYQGMSKTFANATDKISIQGAAPTDGPTPEYVAIFTNTTDTLSTATCCAVPAYATFTSGVSVTAPGSGDAYVTSYGASFSYNAGTNASPSWTTFTVGTDVLYDNTRGAYKWADNSNRHGQWVKATYFYIDPAGVLNNIGPTGVSQDLRKFRITSEEPEVYGDTPLYPEGVEAIFFSVNVAGIATSDTYPDEDFDTGEQIELECLTDPSQNNQIGTRRIFSPKMTLYTQQSV